MKTLILMACLATAVSAGAQTVWRCGPDGRDYRDAPCEHGRTVAVAVADTRSAAELAAARQVAAQDRALAQRLERERLAREREQRAAGSGLAGFRTTPPLSAAAERRAEKAAAKPKAPQKGSKRPAAPDTYRATASSSRHAAG